MQEDDHGRAEKEDEWMAKMVCLDPTIWRPVIGLCDSGGSLVDIILWSIEYFPPPWQLE